MQQYFPDHRDRGYLNKQWVCDIAATVVGEPFETWVFNRVQERNNGVRVKESTDVMMDQAVY